MASKFFQSLSALFKRKPKPPAPALPISTESPEAVRQFLELGPSSPSFLVVYASPQETDGLMWCGDCRQAEPIINAKFKGRTEIVKVVYAGSQAEWRTPDNPWRQKPFSIEKLPTLVKVSGDKWERLVEADCSDANKLDGFCWLII